MGGGSCKLRLLPRLDYKLNLVLWIGFSFLLYAISTNIAWHYRDPRPRRIGRLLRAVKRWPRWPFQALHLLYYLGIPYLALLQGVTSPRLMGLVGADWFEGIGMGAALGTGAFLFLALAWWHYARAIQRSYPREGSLFSARISDILQPWGWPLLLLEVICLEMHWAFYRSGPTLLLDHHSGVFLGLLIALGERYSDPNVRRSLSSPKRAENILMEGGMALVIAVVYLFTRNLWLCMFIHLWIEMGLLCLLSSL